MLPLCREAAVARGDCPAIGFGEFGVMSASIEHGFNREGHAFLQDNSGAGLAEMQHLWIFMKNSANAVAAIFAHD